MLTEISQAADFLCRLLNKAIEPEPLLRFRSDLVLVFQKRFEGHWDTSRPDSGNGYRSISNFNGSLDSTLAEAAKKSSVSPRTILSTLPRDLVLWIDPFNVSYRVGDYGNINTLFEDKSRGRVVLRSPDFASGAQISAATLASQLQIAAAVAGYPTPRSSPRMFAPGPRAVRITPPPSPPGKAAGKMVAVN